MLKILSCSPVRRLAGMDAHVSGESVLRLEFLPAELAVVGHLALAVDLGHVLPQRGLGEADVADLAQILVVRRVRLDIMPGEG